MLNINGKTLTDILPLKENRHPGKLSDLSKATRGVSGKTGLEAKGPDSNKASLVTINLSFLMVKIVLGIP